MKHKLSFTALVLLMGVGSDRANAQAVFSQPWDGTSNLTASQNAPNGLGNFITYYDDFALGANTAITKATWVGGYFNPPAVGPITGFTLTFWSDNAGIPGSALMTENIAGKAGETAAPGSPVNGIPIFDYSTAVVAASYNPLDVKIASGQMRATIATEMPFIPGLDFSGTVDALGAGVSEFTIGDEVYGCTSGGGAYAELIAIDGDKVARKPSTLRHDEAASLVVVGQTAIQALELANLKPGQTILIHGAGGAVGSVAVQIAHHLGARVIASANGKSRDRLLGYGADEVIDYKTTPFESIAKDVEVVLDGIGGDVQQRSFSVLKPRGLLLALTQPPSQEEAAKHKVRAIMLFTNMSKANLQALAAKIDAGEVRPFVGRTYPLSAAGQAWMDVRSQHIEGKIVFTIA